VLFATFCKEKLTAACGYLRLSAVPPRVSPVDSPRSRSEPVGTETPSVEDLSFGRFELRLAHPLSAADFEL